MLRLATCVPHTLSIHGAQSDNFIVIYDYELEDFYSNNWKSETKFYIKHMRGALDKKILKNSEKIQLVEIFRTNDIEFCVIHTYKINLLKRRWKKYYYNLIM